MTTYDVRVTIDKVSTDPVALRPVSKALKELAARFTNGNGEGEDARLERRVNVQGFEPEHCPGGVSVESSSGKLASSWGRSSRTDGGNPIYAVEVLGQGSFSAAAHGLADKILEALGRKGAYVVGQKYYRV